MVKSDEKSTENNCSDAVQIQIGESDKSKFGSAKQLPNSSRARASSPVVLKPNTDNSGTETCHLYQLFLRITQTRKKLQILRSLQYSTSTYQSPAARPNFNNCSGDAQLLNQREAGLRWVQHFKRCLTQLWRIQEAKILPPPGKVLTSILMPLVQNLLYF